ncbi:MAG TPA: DUF4349 domain-containing protein [Anaerolineae bacterium]|nr:DUF4349 domain-containing protein [Anaerolineae bacterium]
MMQFQTLVRNTWGKPGDVVKTSTQIRQAFLLLMCLFIVVTIAEGASLLYTYWRLRIAVRETAQWATAYIPSQGHHLDGSACILSEDCFNETDEDYLARRTAFIKATAMARVQDRREVVEEEVPYLLRRSLLDPISVEVWGYSSFWASKATRDHPGLPGLPVEIRMAKDVHLATPILATIFPSVRLTVAEAMVNEGIQAGQGSMPPPSFDTNSETAWESTQSLLATNETTDVVQFIVKEGALDVEVNEIEPAVERVAQIAKDFQGYITDQRVWREGETQLATITIAVPEEEFENALEQLRGVAKQILSEEVSGKDVTKQYIDLEGRLRNQKATRDRVLMILEQATTVEEALQVNQELSNIEGKIEEIQGQLNSLHNQVFFSTITVNLAPVSLIRGGWRPMQAVGKAVNALIMVLRNLGNLLIWVVIVGVPLFLLVYGAIWGGCLISQRFRKKSTPPIS